MRRVLVLLMFAVMVGAQISAGAAEDRLPTDPALVTGTLPNGLSYIVRPHKNPEGRVSIWLHVSSGSLNETDATRGLAHYLEHMAFNGSANFPPGSVVPFFQSLGLAFGRDQNAFTSFDQTTYQLTLPGGGQGRARARAMVFMSDVATRLSLAHARDRQRAPDHPRGEARPVERSPARPGPGRTSGWRPSRRSAAACPSAPRRRSRRSGATTSWTTTRAGTCRAT